MNNQTNRRARRNFLQNNKRRINNERAVKSIFQLRWDRKFLRQRISNVLKMCEFSITISTLQGDARNINI